MEAWMGNMNMKDLLYGHSKWRCMMDKQEMHVDMQHRHAEKWTCNVDMQQGHEQGHAAWKRSMEEWIGSMYM
jgi:hypothetical protein